MLARGVGRGSSLAVGLQRLAGFVGVEPAETCTAFLRCVHTATDVDSKPLNLCNAVNEALHIAMDTNDR
jgi:hypothetical protein